jgi:hypothetical protein
MAEAAGTDRAGCERAFKSIQTFYDPVAGVPVAGVEVTLDDKRIQTMDVVVRQARFKPGILGKGARSPDDAGRPLPGGETMGLHGCHPGPLRLRLNGNDLGSAAERGVPRGRAMRVPARPPRRPACPICAWSMGLLGRRSNESKTAARISGEEGVR